MTVLNVNEHRSNHYDDEFRVLPSVGLRHASSLGFLTKVQYIQKRIVDRKGICIQGLPSTMRCCDGQRILEDPSLEIPSFKIKSFTNNSNACCPTESRMMFLKLENLRTAASALATLKNLEFNGRPLKVNLTIARYCKSFIEKLFDPQHKPPTFDCGCSNLHDFIESDDYYLNESAYVTRNEQVSKIEGDLLENFLTPGQKARLASSSHLCVDFFGARWRISRKDRWNGFETWNFSEHSVRECLLNLETIMHSRTNELTISPLYQKRVQSSSDDEFVAKREPWRKRFRERRVKRHIQKKYWNHESISHAEIGIEQESLSLRKPSNNAYNFSDNCNDRVLNDPLQLISASHELFISATTDYDTLGRYEQSRTEDIPKSSFTSSHSRDEANIGSSLDGSRRREEIGSSENSSQSVSVVDSTLVASDDQEIASKDWRNGKSTQERFCSELICSGLLERERKRLFRNAQMATYYGSVPSWSQTIDLEELSHEPWERMNGNYYRAQLRNMPENQGRISCSHFRASNYNGNKINEAKRVKQRTHETLIRSHYDSMNVSSSRRTNNSCSHYDNGFNERDGKIEGHQNAFNVESHASVQNGHSKSSHFSRHTQTSPEPINDFELNIILFAKLNSLSRHIRKSRILQCFGKQNDSVHREFINNQSSRTDQSNLRFGWRETAPDIASALGLAEDRVNCKSAWTH